MGRREFTTLIIIVVAILLVVLDVFSHLRVKGIVRSSWGKTPYQPRLDREGSLKDAWFTEKKSRSWDSEIDDLIWYGLDMLEVPEGINNTYSSTGSGALYQHLRNFDLGEDYQLERLVTLHRGSSQLREGIQYQFARLGRGDHSFARQYLADGESKEVGRIGLFIFLNLLPLVGVGLLPLGRVLGTCLAIGGLVFNTVYYLVKKQTLEAELNNMSYLTSTISATNQLAKMMTPL